jgi:polar amino acid transport system substrate-binding protein
MGRLVSGRRRLFRFGAIGLMTVSSLGSSVLLGARLARAQTEAIPVPKPGASPTVDAIRKAKVFRAGIAVAAPWLFLDPKTHQYLGPSITFADAIAKNLGVAVRYVQSNWDVIIAGLQADKFDAIMAPLFATEARRKVVDFVNYTSAGSCYVVLKNNKKTTDLESLNKPDVTVETYTGTGNEQGFVKKYSDAHDYSIPPPLGGAVNVIDVLNQRVDALVINSTDGVWIADQYPSVRILPKDADYCATHPDIPFPIGMAYRKGDAAFGEFAQAVAKSIAAQMQAEIVKYSAPEFMKGQ